MDYGEEANRAVTPSKKTPTGTTGTDNATPDAFPVPPPPQFQAVDHSWVLQTIMELQKTTGQLTEAVHTLSRQTEKHGDKLDSISHRIYGAAAVLAALGAIIYFFLDRMWGQILSVLQHLPVAKP